VAETLCEMGGAPKLLRFGFPDRFGHIATYKTMLERYGLTETNVANVISANL
jgi:transketolase C-terminal domain/subunit